MALPQDGHLEALLHVFAYLKVKHNAHSVYDPTYPEIDMEVFEEQQDWKHFYGDVKEAIPPNAPTARGKEVDLQLHQ